MIRSVRQGCRFAIASSVATACVAGMWGGGEAFATDAPVATASVPQQGEHLVVVHPVLTVVGNAPRAMPSTVELIAGRGLAAGVAVGLPPELFGPMVDSYLQGVDTLKGAGQQGNSAIFALRDQTDMLAPVVNGTVRPPFSTGVTTGASALESADKALNGVGHHNSFLKGLSDWGVTVARAMGF